MVAAKIILISAAIMGCLVYVLSQAQMEFVKNHLVHGKNNIINSKVKPLNSRLHVLVEGKIENNDTVLRIIRDINNIQRSQNYVRILHRS